jgi:hypothetical protein
LTVSAYVHPVVALFWKFTVSAACLLEITEKSIDFGLELYSFEPFLSEA